MQRCQTWPPCRKEKNPGLPRTHSAPVDVSVFDGINNLGAKQNAADL
ncbi:hypothetical protein N9A45_01880 [bacterium]|nr:hypothetical protein [bacterium]